ncbi:putative nucleoside triphosphate hydrolase [Vibrio nigripulchritudo MADA3029]|uniref:ATP-binding protein n=1 Tax=Vibrio nigripulchritudo TaxID=28173 RepID=UPI0003B22DA2|nr:ATP-binding protein [Vibrio nigripulchritudo]CCN45923.1 putative nucleoside triphosphate hydrolase [Vibrio nigripulchritudo MADA3020]CCN56026.1 putative nucleoside triphosphate hydrolase [Vibrio nigripulchritudo MADA3021]CCN59769.1 putative nucleoside triphosphate hydrolase [Vibrio nigripulchritudo MADA3029]
MTKPRLTLVRGLPGSGKSTLAKTMNAKHIEADMYFVDPKGEYRFQPRKLKQAHNWCFNQTKKWLNKGSDVVVSNTFIEKWEMEPYLLLAKASGFEIDIMVCREDFGSIHDVPSDTIEKMKSNWQE